MHINFVLIDAENVKPENLLELKQPHFRVYLFLGAKMKCVSVEVVTAMQELQPNSEYLKVSNSGPNALDFHVAYYIGKLSAETPGACFHIISKDKGFDPLIQHLKQKGITCVRRLSVLEVTNPKVANPKVAKQKVADNSDPEQLASKYYSKIIGPGKARPGSQTTLKSSIHSFFQKALSEQQVSNIIEILVASGRVVVTNNKTSYPKKAAK